MFNLSGHLKMSANEAADLRRTFFATEWPHSGRAKKDFAKTETKNGTFPIAVRDLQSRMNLLKGFVIRLTIHY